MSDINFSLGTLVSKTFENVTVKENSLTLTGILSITKGKVSKFVGNIDEVSEDLDVVRIGRFNYSFPVTINEDDQTMASSSSSVNIHNQTYAGVQKEVSDIMYKFIELQNSSTEE